jgi:hypothetical protein
MLDRFLLSSSGQSRLMLVGLPLCSIGLAPSLAVVSPRIGAATRLWSVSFRHCPNRSRPRWRLNHLVTDPVVALVARSHSTLMFQSASPSSIGFALMLNRSPLTRSRGLRPRNRSVSSYSCSPIGLASLTTDRSHLLSGRSHSHCSIGLPICSIRSHPVCPIPVCPSANGRRPRTGLAS